MKLVEIEETGITYRRVYEPTLGLWRVRKSLSVENERLAWVLEDDMELKVSLWSEDQ